MPPFICSINRAVHKAVTQAGEVDAAVGAWTPVHVGQTLELVHNVTWNVAMETGQQGVPGAADLRPHPLVCSQQVGLDTAMVRRLPAINPKGLTL